MTLPRVLDREKERLSNILISLETSPKLYWTIWSRWSEGVAQRSSLKEECIRWWTWTSRMIGFLSLSPFLSKAETSLLDGSSQKSNVNTTDTSSMLTEAASVSASDWWLQWRQSTASPRLITISPIWSSKHLSQDSPIISCFGVP